MRTERIDIAGRTFSYKTDLRSWHPTFEAVFVYRRQEQAGLADVARALSPYGNVYLVDVDRIPRSARGTDSDALLGWTTATGVRKPLLIAVASAGKVADGFARRFPQFTLGVVVLPVEERRARWPSLLGPISEAVSLVFGRSRERSEVAPRMEEAIGAPLLVLALDWANDARATSDSIRRFAASIRPSSPAAERLPEHLRRS